MKPLSSTLPRSEHYRNPSSLSCKQIRSLSVCMKCAKNDRAIPLLRVHIVHTGGDDTVSLWPGDMVAACQKRRAGRRTEPQPGCVHRSPTPAAGASKGVQSAHPQAGSVT